MTTGSILARDGYDSYSEGVGLPLPATIVKRDGRVVPFDIERIENALLRCFASFDRTPATSAAELARRVANILMAKGGQPTVESVQDIVEMVLQAAGEFEGAKRYILYRAEHAQQRGERPIPASVRRAFDESATYFPTQLQQFQFFDKYSRFDYDLARRETWVETVDRAVDFLRELSGSRLPSETYARVRKGILDMRAMPSMRLLAMAGPAARRTNVAIYNCSYQPVESIASFVEALLISMSGCGVGFSVESQYVENFPRIRRQSGAAPLMMTVEDSAEGWADALRFGMETWFAGGDIRFDLSLLRPSGAPLKIKGGRASGPEPLRVMLDFVRSRILARQGSFLRPIDAHDMMCAVGNAAVSGGVRRCLPAGTRVHTKRGAIPIEEVDQHDDVMTADGYKPVTGWVDQGVQEVVAIRTETGMTFTCTPTHRVAVLSDVYGGYQWKHASELQPDDRLLFITHPIDGQPQALAALPEKRSSDHSGSSIKQPELDTETAWIMGKFFADGYVQIQEHDERGKGGNTQFAFSCNTNETTQIERISAWMEQHGIPARLVYQDGNWLNIRSGNRQIARWMSEYKQPNTPLVIPEALWRSPADVRAAFVAGLMDGDGCYTDRPVTVVATVYEAFAKETVKLLATLGIIAEIRQRRPETEAGWKAQWIVTIKDALALVNAAEVIGSHSCGTWIPRKGKQAGYSVPGWMVKRDLKQQEYANLWPSSRDENMNSATLTSLVDATHYVPVKVLAVEPAGEAHTYDIEVEDGHTFVAEGYLVHNTAMISLFDYDDLEMRHSKDGDFERENSQRWNANNSAVWPEGGLTQIEVAEQVMAMVQSGRGEPGIFNRQAALDMRPERREAAVFGTNPCVTGDTWVHTAEGPRRVFDLVDRQHWTVINGQPFQTTAEGFWMTGRKPVLRLRTKEGYSLRLTDNHKVRVVTYHTRKVERTEWREAGTLQPGDVLKLHTHRDGVKWAGTGSYNEGWLLGSLVGDGTFSAKIGQQGQTLTMAHLDYWGAHSATIADAALARLKETVKTRADLGGVAYEPAQKVRVQSAGLAHLAYRFGIVHGAKTVTDAVEKASYAFYQGFLQGLFDADGTVIGNQIKGVSVRLAQSDLPVLEAVQRMLLRLGIVATLYQNRRPSGYRPMPDGKGGLKEYWTEANHEIVISNDNIQQFAEVIGFSDPDKSAKLAELISSYRRVPNREMFSATIESIEADGEDDVYDCAVPGPNAFDANGIMAHNCGEIVLRPWQFCNLSAAVARYSDTYDTLKEKVEIAAIIGTIQSMATHFPGLRDQWRQNCEEERLLGVDITGQMDSPAAQDADIQRRLKDVAIETNREYAAVLGINQSASVSCVKPSGNSSQLLDCSSGLHSRWSPYYVRNVRVAANSPIYKVLRDAGVPMDPENGQTPDTANTWVIHFPTKAPDGAITRNGRSAIEQCDYWLQNKLNWTEHNPSVTITYKPDEVLDIMKWIWEHRAQLGGMAFLPSFDAQYAQLPYIEIDRAEYEKRAAVFPKVDYSKIWRYEENDLTQAAQELACASGSCEIDVI